MRHVSHRVTSSRIRKRPRMRAIISREDPPRAIYDLTGYVWVCMNAGDECYEFIPADPSAATNSDDPSIRS